MKTNFKLLLFLCFFLGTTLVTKAQDLNLKIMSFNIQQPNGTNWDARKANVASIFNTTQADVVGTQEAVNYQRDYIAQQTGYAWFGTGRDGGDNGEGSWIYYKANKYTLDTANSGSFWMSNTPTVPSSFGGSYNRICTYVHLIEKSSGKGFYLFNAHFPTPDLPDARLKSMKLLTQRMNSRAIPSDPVYATGDFNSNETDATTVWMKNGSDNPIKCRDTYRDVNPTGSVNTGFGTKYDYIYCPNDAKYVSLSSWVISSPVGSDHFAIAAEVQFKGQSNPPITHNIPGKIEAEQYSNASGVELENTTDTGAGKNIGYLDVNDWVEYKVNVATTGNYNFELRVASTVDNSKINVLVDGQLNQSITFPLTNGWQTWQTITKTIDLSSGLHTIKLQVVNSGLNLNWFNFFSSSPVNFPIPGKIEAEQYASASGVELENTTDTGAGKNISYLDVNDWVEYKVNVATTGNYNFELRVASTVDNSKINVLVDGQLNQSITFPLTNGWQTWQTITKTIDLSSGLHTIKLQVVNSGLNLNWFNFFSSSPVNFPIPGKIEAEQYASASGVELENTTDTGAGKNISYLDVNDWVEYKVNVATAGNYNFELRVASTVDNAKINVLVDGQLNQAITFPLTNGWQNWQTITKNIDLTAGLHTLKLQVVTAGFNLNWLNFTSSNPTNLSIPGKIEAENYAITYGTQLEDTSDTGGGKNVGYFDVNDILEYNVNVISTANYTFGIRVASLDTSGRINILVDNQFKKTIDLPITGGWQIWQTLNASLDLTQGSHVLKIEVVKSGFNLNWFNFSNTAFSRSIETKTVNAVNTASFYPNPASDYIHFDQEQEWVIYSLSGEKLLEGKSQKADVSNLKSGIYTLLLGGQRKKIVIN